MVLIYELQVLIYKKKVFCESKLDLSNVAGRDFANFTLAVAVTLSTINNLQRDGYLASKTLR